MKDKGRRHAGTPKSSEGAPKAPNVGCLACIGFAVATNLDMRSRGIVIFVIAAAIYRIRTLLSELLQRSSRVLSSSFHHNSFSLLSLSFLFILIVGPTRWPMTVGDSVVVSC